MGTYNANFTWFQRRLNDAIATFGVDRLMVGLETVIDGGPDDGKPYNASMLEERFALLSKNNWLSSAAIMSL